MCRKRALFVLSAKQSLKWKFNGNVDCIVLIEIRCHDKFVPKLVKINIRRSLLDRIPPAIRPVHFTDPSNVLLTHILLHGCKDLPDDTNRELLQGTICFIRETGRFD